MDRLVLPLCGWYCADIIIIQRMIMTMMMNDDGDDGGALVEICFFISLPFQAERDALPSNIGLTTVV